MSGTSLPTPEYGVITTRTLRSANSTNSAPGAACAAVRVPEELNGIRKGTMRKERTPARSALVINLLNLFMPKAYSHRACLI
jgi:hypothetical protein